MVAAVTAAIGDMEASVTTIGTAAIGVVALIALFVLGKKLLLRSH